MTNSANILSLAAIACLFSLMSCVSTDRAEAESRATSDIHWPAKYDPARSQFFVHNEIAIDAAPEVVWSVLTDYTKWSSYYRGAKDVSLADTSQTKLSLGSVIVWKTMGLSFRSTVREWVSAKRLSWESVNSKITGYHAWLIVPQGRGCKLITDESQLGWLTYLERTFQPNKLSRLHDEWLLAIKKQAEQRAR